MDCPARIYPKRALRDCKQKSGSESSRPFLQIDSARLIPHSFVLLHKASIRSAGEVPQSRNDPNHNIYGCARPDYVD
jgi:hypothetical protein